MVSGVEKMRARVVILDGQDSKAAYQAQQEIGRALTEKGYRPDINITTNVDEVVEELDRGGVDAVVASSQSRQKNISDLGIYCGAAEVPFYLTGDGKPHEGATSVETPSKIAELLLQQ